MLYCHTNKKIIDKVTNLSNVVFGYNTIFLQNLAWTKTGLTWGTGCHVAHTSRLALLAVTYIALGAASTAGSITGVLTLYPRETRWGLAATCLSQHWIRAWWSTCSYRHINETVKNSSVSKIRTKSCLRVKIITAPITSQSFLVSCQLIIRKS